MFECAGGSFETAADCTHMKSKVSGCMPKTMETSALIDAR